MSGPLASFTRSLLAVLTAAYLGVSVLSAEIPDWIETETSRRTGTPTWVAEDRAVIDGVLQWELFAPDVHDLLEMMVEGARKAAATQPGENAEGRCTAILSGSDVAAESDSTSETIFERSSAVYLGRVVDIEQGFLLGRPGTMLELEVEEVLKGTEPTAASIFVYYQSARIRLRDAYLCSRSRRREFDPHLGGTLIYARRRERRPDFQELPLFVAKDPELYFEAADGTFSAPYGLDDLATSVSSFASVLRLEAARGTLSQRRVHGDTRVGALPGPR